MRLMPAELSVEVVREAVCALVEDSRYLGAVRSHRAGIEAMPSPQEVVPTLAGMV